MNVPYASRSSFKRSSEQGTAAQREALESGQTIVVLLPSDGGVKGYSGRLTVTIDPTDAASFQADRAPKRFPARIKAAATALRDCGCHGGFLITHEGGIVSISKVMPDSGRH